MTTVSLVLTVAAVALATALWRRIPAPPVLLLAGLMLGASGLLPGGPLLQHTMLLGLTFLVFVVGSELDVSRVGDQLGVAVRAGIAQFVALGAIGFLAAQLFGFEWLAACYVALALTSSSTLLIVSVLRQRQQLFEPYARIVLGAMLVQDALVVLLLPILTHATDDAAAIVSATGATIGMIALSFVCVRWVAPRILLRWRLDDESMLLVVLSILFIFLHLAHLADLPLVIGAFLAGVSLSGFPVRGVVRAQLNSLSDFFLAIFFVALGASVSLPGWRQMLLEGILLTSVLLFTPPLVMLIVRRAGLSLRASIEAAHLMAQCGELSLVVVLLGVERQHLPPNLLSATIMLVVFTMTLMPFLSSDAVTWRLMRWIPGQRRPANEKRPSGHVLLLGCGRHTRTILERLLQQGQQIVVVDDDAGVVETLRRSGVTAFRGDGADYRVLRDAGARDARVIVSTMRRRRDNERLLRFSRHGLVLIRVFTPEDGRYLQDLGATPIVEADAAADEFLQHFEAILAPTAEVTPGSTDTTSAEEDRIVADG